MRVFTRQRGVVAADLGARPLGMRQEIQIVDGHDLRRGPRRQQQRMRRMRDVVRAAGEHFGWRPSEPMPRQIQQPHGHAAIDDRRACQVRIRREPILPRAREERQLERRRRTAWRVRGKQCLDELMCILAGAAAFTQRRAVIDQDAHLFKSCRVSILL